MMEIQKEKEQWKYSVGKALISNKCQFTYSCSPEIKSENLPNVKDCAMKPQQKCNVRNHSDVQDRVKLSGYINCHNLINIKRK